MNITRIASAISSILAFSLLSACGGGGGGVVRNSPAPQSPPPPGTPPASPPPPPPRGLSLPAAPAVKATPAPPNLDDTSAPGFNERIASYRSGLGSEFSYDSKSGSYILSNSKHSSLDAKTAGSLTKQGSGTLDVGWQGNSRFDGGVRISSGTLALWDNLFADVSIEPGATLDFANWANVIGDVRNDGVLDATEQGGAWYDDYYDGDIFGDYSQTANGKLQAHLGLQSADQATPLLTVSGTATLDGTLEFLKPYPVYVPNGAYLEWVLHAHGGVLGQFARWTSPGLLIEGNLRYGSNDVWLELTRLSVQVAMAGQGFSGITLASAGNLDRALAIADGFMMAPNTSQSRFLHSAGRLLWLGDAQQAARSLDSLAGSLHVDAVDALANDDALARGIGARMLALRPGDHAGSWSRLRGGDTMAGFDHWLSPRLLVGATAAQARAARSDALGGQSQHESPQAALYLRWFGNDGWYAGGSAGYARHALALDRRIDLADGGQWNARAQRRLGIASLDAEAGRRFSAGGMTIAPYLWLGADAIRSEAAIEQGQTGLELTLQANTQARLDAGVGVRIGKRWSVGETGWVAFDADARYRQRLMQADDPLRAAFIGVPDLWFDVPGHEARSGTWLDLGLRGGFGHGWAWSLGHAGSLAGQADGRHWKVGLARRF